MQLQMCEKSKCGTGAKRDAADRSHKSWSTPEVADVTGRLVPTQSPLSGASIGVFWGMYSQWALERKLATINLN